MSKQPNGQAAPNRYCVCGNTWPCLCDAPRLAPPGPPERPRCDYCEAGRPAGVGPSYRPGCTKHDPAMRAAVEEDIYETALLGLAHLADEEEIDVRRLMPHPDRVPADLETRMTMGEFRARIRSVRGA